MKRISRLIALWTRRRFARFRTGKNETLACMGGYVLQRQDHESWLIELKQINLIDADQAQGNISFMP